MTSTIITFFLLSITGTSYNSDIKDELEKTYSAFVECSSQSETACESFTYQALGQVYQEQSFFDINTNDKFYQLLKDGGNWEELGQAYNQEVLRKAQEKANAGKAVVAVYTNKNDQPLHVAVILPGDLNQSGSWGLIVPNSASFPDFDPDHAFVNKPLSYAFEKRNLLSIKIYALE